jgi:hypothetical protein
MEIPSNTQPVVVDPADEAPDASPRGHQEWSQWKAAPTPGNLSLTLKALDPVISKAVSRYPKFHPAVMNAEAKRLAIGAIRSFDPNESASLSTHVFNHLRPMSRFSEEASRAVVIPREARTDVANLSKMQRDFMEENNREPNDSEIQDALGISGKKLTKLRNLSHYEFAEGALEESPESQQDDPMVRIWADYVYHDLNPRDKAIMDHRLGRNGRPVLSTEETAAKLGIHPTYVNRRAQEIAEKILRGINESRGGPVDG